MLRCGLHRLAQRPHGLPEPVRGLKDTRGRHRARRGLGTTAADAVAATAVAAVVDLAIVPRRLTPGFERRLSARSLALVYGALAVGLLLGARRLDR